MELKDFKMVVAQNIYYLRTQNQLTQYELGQKLNYSDKAISKWERGDGMPDAYVLTKIAELFGVTVDYILTEHKEQEKRNIETKPKTLVKLLITLIAVVSVFAVAVLIYVLLSMYQIYHWQVFIYAIPVASVVAIVLSSVWHKAKGVLAYVSVLVWSIIATIYFAIGDYSLWTLFLIGIPLQVIVFILGGIRVTIKFSKKEWLGKAIANSKKAKNKPSENDTNIDKKDE